MQYNIKEHNSEYINNTIEFAKKINAKDFSSKEQEQANIVIEDFKTIEPSTPKIHMYRHFNSEDIANMFYTTLNTYSIFDNEHLIAIIKDYLDNISIIDGEYADDSLFQIIYETIIENNTPFKIPKAIIIPSTLNNNTAGHHFAYTLALILKNNSFQEQRLFMTYDEVVPSLLEMISAYESSPIETIEVFRKKRDFIIKNIKIYNNYLKLLEDAVPEEKEHYKLLLSTAGKHLTSFYYAISLFYKYLEKPFSILDDVHDVLDCQASSLDLINKYMSNKENNDYDNYQKGLTKFKKIIS